MLSAMRYKEFTWPHNPRTYTIEYQRSMAVNKVPFGRYHLQDLGPTRRVMRGEGEFVGEDAYAQFQKLASVFYREGPGLLVHPVWQCAKAYFVELSLRQEPRRDYVSYTFTFWETFEEENNGITMAGTGSASSSGPGNTNTGTGETWHTVERGESLWSIAQTYGISLTDLITRNPQIKNPNYIRVGEKVRIS